MCEEKKDEWTLDEKNIRDRLLLGYNMNECIGKHYYEDKTVGRVALAIGNESRNSTNLLFLCSLLVNIGRELRQPVYYMISKMGEKELRHISEFWDVLCAENIDAVTYRYTDKYELKVGTEEIKTSLSIFQEAKVYVKVIEDRISKSENTDEIQVLIDLFMEQNIRRERTLEMYKQFEKIKKETHMMKIDHDQWMPPFYKRMRQVLEQKNRKKGIRIIIEYLD